MHTYGCLTLIRHIKIYTTHFLYFLYHYHLHVVVCVELRLIKIIKKMTEKPEEVKLATPIYTRNAKKRYYEKRNKIQNIWNNIMIA